MAGTSTPYKAGGEAADIWINSHGNALEAQGHHGEPIVRSHDAPVVPDPRHAGFGQGGAGVGYEGGVRDRGDGRVMVLWARRRLCARKVSSGGLRVI